VHDAEQLVVVDERHVIVERMPCMMTECAREAAVIVASDDRTEALWFTTSLRIDFESTIARSCRRGSSRSSASDPSHEQDDARSAG